MPPHCDSLDGPVVEAAREALVAENADIILPFVPVTSEPELRSVFDKVVAARGASPAAREVADRYLFETAVRLHRLGENAPYNGLKPAGLDVGPVIPATERDLAAGSPDDVLAILMGTLRSEVFRRFERAIQLRATRTTVAETRAYVSAVLGFQVWSNTVYKTMTADLHGDEAETTAHVHVMGSRQRV